MSTAVARILDDLRDRGGLKGVDIANIVDASPPTVSRWTKGRASPPLHTQTIIAELRYVVDRLADSTHRRKRGFGCMPATRC